MAYATKSILGRKRPMASEARESWTAATDGAGRVFWFNEVTHESSDIDPTAAPHTGEAFDALSEQRLYTVSALSSPTPFDSGCMSPAERQGPARLASRSVVVSGGHMTPSETGYMMPSANSYVQPPIMTPPAGGYISHSSSACMSPIRSPHYQHHHHHHYHHHHLHEQHPPQHEQDYHLVQTRPACLLGQEWEAAACQPSLHGRGAQDSGRVSMSPPPASRVATGGYRWEECYRQSNGKKFWRHRETGVILTEDPYH